MSVDILGPTGTREMGLMRQCEVREGHTHNYDHTTFVMTGAVQVFYRKAGEDVERESRVYRAPARFAVLANIYHRIVALEPDTEYWCVFSHRDANGLVVEEYLGNDGAYV